MLVCEAVSKKILDICDERDISVNKLANISCLTQSTLENIVNCKSKNPKILTIVRLCEGLDMNLEEFFSDEVFYNIDRED